MARGCPCTFVEVAAILDWLASLPTTVLDARPSLWVRYASVLLVGGQTTGVEEKLQAAEAALQGAEPDDKTRDLIGQIAAARATLALTHYQIETIITQSRRALEYLRPDNLYFPLYGKLDMWRLPIVSGENVPQPARPLLKPYLSPRRPGIFINTSLATICLGQITGIRKPALSGGRDLPARSATAW